MDGYEYQLTPRSGERLAAADKAAQDANLLGMAVGHNVMETSFGRNAALRLALSGLRRFNRHEFGDVALSTAPVVEERKVRIPANAALHLRGDTLLLRGKEVDGSQVFDFTGKAPGAYALVLESWVSLVGATTLGQATLPTIYVGVTDAAHKPDATHFHAGGNKDGGVVPDAVFADTTIQTTKLLQRQYRITVIPDRDLAGWTGVELPAGNSYTAAGQYLTECVLAQGVGAWDKAVDRSFQAVKLAVVKSTGAALTLHLTNFRVTDTYSHLGQQPAPLRLNRADLEGWLFGTMQQVEEKVDSFETRILSLEAEKRYCVLTSDEEQIVMPVSSNGGVMPQRLRFTAEGSDLREWHDSVAAPSVIRVDFTGLVSVTGCVTFSPSATGGIRSLRVLKNGIPTPLGQSMAGNASFDTPLSVSGELLVSAGDRLEIEPWQSSGATLYVRPGAYFCTRAVEIIEDELPPNGGAG